MNICRFSKDKRFLLPDNPFYSTWGPQDYKNGSDTKLKYLVNNILYRGVPTENTYIGEQPPLTLKFQSMSKIFLVTHYDMIYHLLLSHHSELVLVSENARLCLTKKDSTHHDPQLITLLKRNAFVMII